MEQFPKENIFQKKKKFSFFFLFVLRSDKALKYEHIII